MTTMLHSKSDIGNTQKTDVKIEGVGDEITTASTSKKIVDKSEK